MVSLQQPGCRCFYLVSRQRPHHLDPAKSTVKLLMEGPDALFRLTSTERVRNARPCVCMCAQMQLTADSSKQISVQAHARLSEHS